MGDVARLTRDLVETLFLSAPAVSPDEMDEVLRRVRSLTPRDAEDERAQHALVLLLGSSRARRLQR